MPSQAMVQSLNMLVSDFQYRSGDTMAELANEVARDSSTTELHYTLNQEWKWGKTIIITQITLQFNLTTDFTTISII